MATSVFDDFLDSFDWPVTPTPNGDWKNLDRGEAESLLENARNGFESSGYTVLAARATPASFYPGHLLLDLLVSIEGERESGLLSFVVGPKLVLLDGNSRQIHDLNGTAPLALDDENAAEDYLRFFCLHIRSDGGAFLVIDNIDDLAWVGAQTDADLRADVASAIQPLAPEETVDDAPGSGYTATVYYKKHLFQCHFRVGPDGVVEMVDDTPIKLETGDNELPIAPQRFSGPVRLIED